MLFLPRFEQKTHLQKCSLLISLSWVHIAHKSHLSGGVHCELSSEQLYKINKLVVSANNFSNLVAAEAGGERFGSS